MKMETHVLVREYQHHELNLDFFKIGGIFLLLPNLKPQMEAWRNPGAPMENAGTESHHTACTLGCFGMKCEKRGGDVHKVGSTMRGRLAIANLLMEIAHTCTHVWVRVQTCEPVCAAPSLTPSGHWGWEVLYFAEITCANSTLPTTVNSHGTLRK